MNISPRTSISTSSFNFSGITFIVLTLWVISSPTVPSPLVAALTNFPFSYNKDTDNPSIFSSHIYSGVIPSFFILSSNVINSSSEKTSDNDIIGIL